METLIETLTKLGESFASISDEKVSQVLRGIS
jgi:hypothetical protein